MIILLVNFLLSGIIVLVEFPEIRKCFLLNCYFDDIVIHE